MKMRTFARLNLLFGSATLRDMPFPFPLFISWNALTMKILAILASSFFSQKRSVSVCHHSRKNKKNKKKIIRPSLTYRRRDVGKRLSLTGWKNREKLWKQLWQVGNVQKKLRRIRGRFRGVRRNDHVANEVFYRGYMVQVVLRQPQEDFPQIQFLLSLLHVWSSIVPFLC